MNKLRRIVAPPLPLRVITVDGHDNDAGWKDATDRTSAYLKALGRDADDPLVALAIERARQRSDASSAGDPAMAALEELHSLLHEEFASTPLGRRERCSHNQEGSANRRLQYGLGNSLDPSLVEAMPRLNRAPMVPEGLDYLPPSHRPTRRVRAAFFPRLNFARKR